MDSFEPPLSRRYAFQQLELMEAGWDRHDAQRIVDTWMADEIKCAPFPALLSWNGTGLPEMLAYRTCSTTRADVNLVR